MPDGTSDSIFAGPFLFSFTFQLLNSRLTGFGVARAKENMKTFACQLPRDFKPDPFIRAGHERDALLHFHEEISLRNRGVGTTR